MESAFETKVEEYLGVDHGVSTYILKSYDPEGVFEASEQIRITSVENGLVYSFPPQYSGLGKIGSLNWDEAEDLHELLGYILRKKGYKCK